MELKLGDDIKKTIIMSAVYSMGGLYSAGRKTPLQVRENKEIIQLLIDKGAIVNNKSLWKACLNGLSDVVEILCSHGAVGDTELMQSVIEWEESATYKDPKDNPPSLFETIFPEKRNCRKNQYFRIIEILLEHGTPFTREDFTKTVS